MSLFMHFELHVSISLATEAISHSLSFSLCPNCRRRRTDRVRPWRHAEPPRSGLATALQVAEAYQYTYRMPIHRRCLLSLFYLLLLFSPTSFPFLRLQIRRPLSDVMRVGAGRFWEGSRVWPIRYLAPFTLACLFCCCHRVIFWFFLFCPRSPSGHLFGWISRRR